MTSRERVAAAMRRETPDRVPFMCQLAIGHYLLHLDVRPADLWLHNETVADAYVALARRYGMDGILINLPGRDPEIDQRVERIEQRPNGDEVVWFKDWPTPLTCPAANLPHHPEQAAVALDDLDPKGCFYEDPHTLGGLKLPFHYDLGGSTAADPSVFPAHVTAIIDLVRQKVGDELAVHGEVFSPFTQLMERLGYEQGLMALLDQPERCRALLARFAEGAGALGQLQAAHGVDAVLISSAFAGGGFISQAMYEEFVLPFEARVVELVHQAGVPVYTHTCGHIGDRLELMAATGIDGIDTMDPPPLGNTDLADAKARVGGELFLKGNLDSVNILLNGQPAQVTAAAERAVAAAGPGGYILSSACSVAPAVPAENVLAMGEVATRGV
ncbi:MAG: hypothetical protein HUU35_08515 [Armatimonadetes bacterium]|nr:hypothetical protein [Armatimonadota bacterium]